MVAALPASKPASAAPAINAFFDLVIVLIQLLFRVCLSDLREYDSRLNERFHRKSDNIGRRLLLRERARERSKI